MGSIGFWVGMREALEALGRRPQSTNPTTFLPVVKKRKEEYARPEELPVGVHE